MNQASEKISFVEFTGNYSLLRWFHRTLKNHDILMKKILLFTIGISLSFIVVAQKSITGKVADGVNGEALVGVNVVVKGTTIGTITDLEGKYSINISNQDSVLQFSFIGYLPEEVKILDQSIINVDLSPDLMQLEQVVVTGYGTQNKREITGAVSVVDVEQLSKSHSTTLTDQLQGRVAGVSVTTSGQPGSMGNIKIRGASFFGGNEPLYVIDGIATGDNPNFNPGDVESVQILKDASSTAIYGNRAANGVIIITTKKGRKGKPKVTFRSTLGVQEITSRLDLTDNYGWARIINATHDNSNAPRQTKADTEFDPSLNVDWQEEVFSKNAPVYDLNLSISGGGEKSIVYFSVNNHYQDGTIKGPNFQRIATRLNSEFELGERITVGQHFTLGYSKTNGVSGSAEGSEITGPFAAAYEMLPVIPVYDEAQPSGYGIGETGVAQTYSENPVAVMDLFTMYNESFSFLGDVFFNYKIIEGLDYRFSLGLNTSYGKYKSYNEAGKIRMASTLTSGLRESRGEARGVFLENRLTYSKVLGRHNFSVMGTHTEEKGYEGLQSTTSEGGYDKEVNFWQISNSTGSISSGGSEYHSAMRSFLGRITYNYNKKYFFTGIIRRDGSSKFAPENRWGTFPSISAGWDISKESFFNLGGIRQLKLRAGYGIVGNASVGDYAYTTGIYSTALGADVWSPGVNYNLGPTSQSIVGATRSNEITNRNISWEELAETNIGLDIEAFSGQLFFAGDYYFGDLNNILAAVPVPGTIGTSERSAPAVNAVSMKRNGWELSVSYKKLTGDFHYTITANLSHSNTEITELAYGLTDLVSEGITVGRVGYPVGMFYLLDYQGIYTQEDIDALPEDFTVNKRRPVVGDAKYRDVNGRDENGKLTGEPDGKISLDDDRIITGNPIPDLQYGLNFYFSYKIIDLSIFFQGVSNRDVYNSYNGGMTSEWTGRYSNYPTYYDPYIDGKGTDPRPLLSPSHANNLQSTRFLENGAYLRLKNLQLGITIPIKKLEDLRVFLSGQNLFTITKYRGLDPEFEGDDVFAPGLDPKGYPSVRTLSFGINLTF